MLTSAVGGLHVEVQGGVWGKAAAGSDPARHEVRVSYGTGNK